MGFNSGFKGLIKILEVIRRHTL